MEETQKLELKVQALLEKMGALENQIADLRVELTVVSMERDELKKMQEKEDAEKKNGTTSD